MTSKLTKAYRVKQKKNGTSAVIPESELWVHQGETAKSMKKAARDAKDGNFYELPEEPVVP